MAAEERGERTNGISAFTCPECGGVLWEIEKGRLLHFRCHVGHSYSVESLFTEQADSLEMALWTAVRALEERATFLRLLATRMRGRGQTLLVDRYEDQAREVERQADTIRQVIRTGASIDPDRAGDDASAI
jgi:two-component system chemotaxis response regulator CheB